MQHNTLFDIVDDNKHCMFPSSTADSAYRRGCRCTRCKAGHSKALRMWQDAVCNEDGCVAFRLKGYRWCALHRPSPTCKEPGCTELRVSGTGNRYCATHKLQKQRERMPTHECLRCGRRYQRLRATRASLCDECIKTHRDTLQQLRRHNLPEDQIRRLLNSDTISCDLCSKQLWIGRSFNGKSGFVVDHDHQCCPGHSGCERCVRGLLCSRCNVDLGHYEALTQRASRQTIASYLSGTNAD